MIEIFFDILFFFLCEIRALFLQQSREFFSGPLPPPFSSPLSLYTSYNVKIKRTINVPFSYIIHPLSNSLVLIGFLVLNFRSLLFRQWNILIYSISEPYQQNIADELDFDPLTLVTKLNLDFHYSFASFISQNLKLC